MPLPSFTSISFSRKKKHTFLIISHWLYIHLSSYLNMVQWLSTWNFNMATILSSNQNSHQVCQSHSGQEPGAQEKNVVGWRLRWRDGFRDPLRESEGCGHDQGQPFGVPEGCGDSFVFFWDRWQGSAFILFMDSLSVAPEERGMTLNKADPSAVGRCLDIADGQALSRAKRVKRSAWHISSFTVPTIYTTLIY